VEEEVVGSSGYFFLPIFLTYTGLRTNVGGLDSTELWGWCLPLLALATLGKFSACDWAARWSDLDHHEYRSADGTDRPQHGL
jgi:Kef-type K+ transport system membrane component KefB